MYSYEKPPEEEWWQPKNFYRPTTHFTERYRARLGEQAKDKLRKHMLRATDEEIGLRANYMLLFSIFGRPGDNEETEVRHYFDWDIVIDNKSKLLITMYQRPNRRLPSRLFGDAKLRKQIYQRWFSHKKE